MRRRILLISGIIVVAIAACLYGLGLYWDADSIPGDPNIGAGIAMMFGGILGALGLVALVAWAIAALAVRLRQFDSDYR